MNESKKDSEYSVGCANGADTRNKWMFSTKELGDHNENLSWL